MARSNRYNRNLSKVQDMLDGNFTGKIQVGAIVEDIHANRKIGERYFDHDDKEWEKTEYGRVSVSKVKVGIFPYQCNDCKKNCGNLQIDKDTHKRFQRCYHCQMDFELDLQSFKNRIGENGNKWKYWVRLQELKRWISGRKDLEEWIDEQHKLNQKKAYDMSVANAMANSNISMEIKKNT